MTIIIIEVVLLFLLLIGIIGLSQKRSKRIEKNDQISSRSRMDMLRKNLENVNK